MTVVKKYQTSICNMCQVVAVQSEDIFFVQLQKMHPMIFSLLNIKVIPKNDKPLFFNYSKCAITMFFVMSIPRVTISPQLNAQCSMLSWRIPDFVI